ncbi:hypothetical protein JM949_17595 [Micromonospora sp. STR1s_6]|uniref:Uncharacterized protein n=1 Tax=Micromonospora tarensis TaxID=2806100 RepID=A0ABS1YI84_9ACTN|nr:hypothetical protein [Micromonospora tarensis]
MLPGTASPGAPPTTAGAPSASPAPAGQLTGLCRAWRAKKPEQREKALRTPAFGKLVTAAGGPARVEAYCQSLVPGAAPTESVSPSESARAKPSPPAKTPPSPPPPGLRTRG